ncbi:DUF1573 domain-containing protein [Sphingomonas canadensis]|uniref:DUF1573 domain-containing protein n=1 Tax=Sphingomonas canadensis TaxID=1219257 RepID=A0ABW3H2U4_9SPHN|nr:DUF1573 domain-containing protein [Sphingomonas canadensis]MCW3835795.1 DUF1573 domain-containing protein [Sphingomonas canadensis]
MKKLALAAMSAAFVVSLGLGAAVVPVSAISAQEVANGAKIEFHKEVHDYGTVKYGGNGTATFRFTNTGNAPLIISKATSSCGCLVPTWPKEPIAPGANGEITVKYDTKRPGPISKTVTITSNAVNEPGKVIRVKGTVSPVPEGGSGPGGPAGY